MTTLNPLETMIGEFDYPMLIVTAAAGGRRAGCLVGFATQCSIDPPRFLICISKRNNTYRVAADAPRLGVHLLSRADKPLSELFGEHTGDDMDKFDHCQWQAGPDGLPLLDDVAGRYVGTVLDRHDVGDHVAFLVEANDAVALRAVSPQLGFQDVLDMEPGHEA